MNEDGQYNYRTSCDTANDDEGEREGMKGFDERGETTKELNEDM